MTKRRKQFYTTAEVITQLSGDDDRMTMAMFSARKSKRWPRMRAYHADGDSIVVQQKSARGWASVTDVDGLPLRDDWSLLKCLVVP